MTVQEKSWVKWTVTLENVRDREIVFSWLHDLSPRGLWELDERTVIAYFDQPPETQVPDLAMTLVKEEEPDRHWAETWRASFRPIRVGQRILVRPPWERAVSGTIDVIIYPAYAFGTGDHPTTALCLEFLERFLQPGMDVLDVGSGSGILSILACRLQAGRIVALDNDPLAISEIQRNMVLNGLEEAGIEYQLGELKDIHGSFDLLVANVGLQYHLDHWFSMLGRLAVGGRFILSGVETTDVDTLKQTVRSIELVKEAEKNTSGWSVLVYNKGVPGT